MSRPDLLLVDDDPIAIEVLTHMLSGFARLRFARTGPDALRLARESCPDLMLLDMDMPGMGGLEVLQHLHADEHLRQLPVIVVTSHRSAELEAEVFERGAVDFLCKPLTPPQVLGRVRAHLRMQRMTKAVERRPADAAIDQGASILVVDDDVGAIQMLSAVLTPLAHRIRFATSGASALAQMMEEPPDLVLLDVQMPGMDGFEVCRAMQADPVLRPIPIALLTRVADADSEAQGLEAGATDFIAKPYRPAVLKARVRNLLRAKRENDLALQALGKHWQRLGEARVSEIVAAASDAIVSLDSAGDIVLINAAACTLFEIPCESVLGEHAADTLRGADNLLAWLAENAKDAAERPRAASRANVIALQKADGTRRLVEPSYFRLGTGDDAITTMLLRDVTERERVEDEARARLEAEAASHAKTMMLSYIAHEIGNPLNGILGNAQLMEADAANALPPTQARRLQTLLTSGWLLQSLLRDVMDLSRIEAGGFALNLAPVDVDAAARTAIDAVAAQAELAGVSLRLHGLDSPASVNADSRRLQQCLANLLSNAIKYNRASGSVDLTVSAQDGFVCFAVIDTGLGMTPDQCAHLFEPFNRLGRGDGNIRGAGLGLVISRLLCEAMGGMLTVESTIGEGSTFTLRLNQSQS